MYFKQIDEIVQGLKTQTRRIAKVPPSNMGIGHEYTFEVLCAFENDWAPANIERVDFPGKGIYIRQYRHGGWLTGDTCVEPDWWDTAKYVVGRDYAVCPGRGLPCVLWRPGFALTYDRNMTVSAQEWTQAHLKACPDHPDGGWRPLRIQITDIRLEKLQAISEADALAEGAPAECRGIGTTKTVNDLDIQYWKNPYFWYLDLWESINGKGSWAKNPDVWVIEFEVKRD